VQAGGGLERSLSKLGASAAEIGQLAVKIKRSNDDTRVRGAINETMAKRTKLLDAQPDPETGKGGGLHSLAGENAIAASSGVIKEFDTAGAASRKALGNDEQKNAFDIAWAKEKLQFQAAVNHHVARQAEVVQKQNLRAGLSGAQTKAISAAKAADHANLEAALQQQRDIIDQEVLGGRMTKDLGEEAKIDLTTETHLLALEVMLNDNMTSEHIDPVTLAPLGAPAYWRMYEDEIEEGRARSQMENTIEVKVEEREGIRLGTSLMMEPIITKDADGNVVSENRSLNETRRILYDMESTGKITTKRRDKALDTAIEWTRDKRAVEDLSNKPLVDEARAFIKRSILEGDTPDLSDIEGNLSRVSPRGEVEILSTMETSLALAGRIGREKAAEVRAKDAAALQNFRGKTLDEKILVNVDRDYKKNVSDTGRDAIRSEFNSAVDTFGKTTPQQRADVQAIILQGIEAAKVVGRPNSRRKKLTTTAAQFETRMFAWRSQFREENNGRNPSSAEMYAQMSWWLARGEVTEEGDWYDSERELYRFQLAGLGFKEDDFTSDEEHKAEAERLKNVFAEFSNAPISSLPLAPAAGMLDIPQDARDQIIQYLKEESRPTTESNIQRVYREHLAKNR
jgi:hypothetical protein